MSTLTVHIAVHYMDLLLQNSEIKQKLGSLVCLIIAAKYDELDRKIPKYDLYIRASGMDISSDDIIKCEKEFLQKLNWQLQVSTSINFIQLFLTQGVIFSNDKIKFGNPSSALANRLSQKAIGFVNSFLEITELMEYTQSIIAASCVALSRKVTGILK